MKSDSASGVAYGRFVTFEGGEGVGKTTQVELFRRRLEALGLRVVMVREPGGTPLAERIRTLLKEFGEDAPCDRAELLLFLAARAQLVERVIKPALAAGAWVLSDRFSDSTYAYQGYGRGLSLEAIGVADAFARAGATPDLTILLDLPPAAAAERLAMRERETGEGADRIESAGREFHERLRRGFLEIAARDPVRVKLVSAAGEPAEVHERIWKYLKPWL